MLNEQSKIRELGNILYKDNLNLTIAFGAGGWYVSLENTETDINAIYISGDILEAINKCFSQIEEMKIDIARNQPTIPAGKKIKKV